MIICDVTDLNAHISKCIFLHMPYFYVHDSYIMALSGLGGIHEWLINVDPEGKARVSLLTLKPEILAGTKFSVLSERGQFR